MLGQRQPCQGNEWLKVSLVDRSGLSEGEHPSAEINQQEAVHLRKRRIAVGISHFPAARAESPSIDHAD
jgi:hypothetical protein